MQNDEKMETIYQVIFDTTEICDGSAVALKKFLKGYGLKNLTILKKGNVLVTFLTKKHLHILRQHYDLVLKIVSITTDKAACDTYNQFFANR